MPRLSAIRETNLKHLAEELRFASRDALLRHIAKAETLARVIDPDQTYPPDWIVFRVTGYRPDTIEGPASTGEQLLKNLSAFVEHLCEAAVLTLDDLPADAVSPETLCARWNISRKSLDRARRKGLVGRRVRTIGPARTLVFMPEAVDAYESRAHPGPSPAGHRMTPEVRAKILRRAARYHELFGMSANQIAQRLAPKFGFSTEAIRKAIKTGLVRGESAFESSSPPSRREQQFAFRALRRGIDPGTIAARLGRPRVSIWRAANAYRAESLLALDLQGPVAPTFTLPDAAEVILNRPALKTAVGMQLPPSLVEVMKAARSQPKPDAGVERDLAIAACFLRWRASGRVSELIGPTQSAILLDEIETDLLRVSRLKQALIVQSLGLIVNTMDQRLDARPESLPAQSLGQLLKAMYNACAHAIDRYDPFRGGRLASPVSLALDRSAARWIASAGPQPVDAGRARRTLSQAGAYWRLDRAFDPWQDWLEPDARIARVLGELEPIDRETLDRRFGLLEHRPHTIDELARWSKLPRVHVVRKVRTSIQRALAVARGTIRS